MYELIVSLLHQLVYKLNYNHNEHGLFARLQILLQIFRSSMSVHACIRRTGLRLWIVRVFMLSEVVQLTVACSAA